MKKRFLAFTLSLVLVSSLLVGCGNKNSTNSGGKDVTPTQGDNNVSSKDENGEKLTVTWWGPMNYAVGAEEGTYGELLIEDLLNIDIKPTFYDAESYKTVRPIELAAGNIPDMMYLMDPVDVQQAAEQGFIMELPFEMIKQYAPTYFNMINEVSPITWIYSNYQGKNYGVVNPNTGGDQAKLSLWRTDWLKNVGIDKVPETIEEMEVAFDAFVNKDPDGNGKKDTYALTGDFRNWHMCFTEIFGAYGILPFNWVDDGNGGVTYGALLPETKEVLKLLASWYEKGYIHPDMITDNSFDETVLGKFKNGQIGYRINGNLGDLNEAGDVSTINVMRQINPSANIALGLPVKGPEGKSGTFAWGNSGHIITFGSHLKDDPEKVIRILKLIEMAYTDEDLAIKLHMGEEGKHWNYLPKEGLTTEMLNFEFVDGLKEKAQYQAAGLNKPVTVTSYWSMFPLSNEVGQKFWTDYNRQFEADFGEKAREVGMSDLFRKPDVLPSAGQYFGDLKNMQLVAFAKIISGEESIDYYDTFIKQWKSSGGDILLQEAQEMKNVVDDVMKRAGVQ